MSVRVMSFQILLQTEHHLTVKTMKSLLTNMEEREGLLAQDADTLRVYICPIVARYDPHEGYQKYEGRSWPELLTDGMKGSMSLSQSPCI